MADMTTLISPMRGPNEFQQPFKYRILDLNFGDAALAAMLAVDTHNIMTLAAGEAIMFGHAVVYTKVTSATNTATLAFQLASGDTLHSGALTANGTELDAGDSFHLQPGEYTTTGGKKCYSDTASTLDMVVGAEAITAGRILLYVAIFDVAAFIANG